MKTYFFNIIYTQIIFPIFVVITFQPFCHLTIYRCLLIQVTFNLKFPEVTQINNHLMRAKWLKCYDINNKDKENSLHVENVNTFFFFNMSKKYSSDKFASFLLVYVWEAEFWRDGKSRKRFPVMMIRF